MVWWGEPDLNRHLGVFVGPRSIWSSAANAEPRAITSASGLPLPLGYPGPCAGRGNRTPTDTRVSLRFRFSLRSTASLPGGDTARQRINPPAGRASGEQVAEDGVAHPLVGDLGAVGLLAGELHGGL